MASVFVIKTDAIFRHTTAFLSVKLYFYTLVIYVNFAYIYKYISPFFFILFSQQYPMYICIKEYASLNLHIYSSNSLTSADTVCLASP